MDTAIPNVAMDTDDEPLGVTARDIYWAHPYRQLLNQTPVSNTEDTGCSCYKCQNGFMLAIYVLIYNIL